MIERRELLDELQILRELIGAVEDRKTSLYELVGLPTPAPDSEVKAEMREAWRVFDGMKARQGELLRLLFLSQATEES